MRAGPNLELSSGCRDRLMVASSVACIVAVFVSVLGLARSLFSVTSPLDRLRAGQFCLHVGHQEPALLCYTWAGTDTASSNQSPQPAAMLDPTQTPMPATATLRPTATSKPPKATVGPTITPAPPEPTPGPSVTVTATLPVSAGVAVATTGHLSPTLALMSPEPEAQLQGEAHFEWQWDGEPLPEGMAFDLLIWSDVEHQEHQGSGAYGVAATDRSMERDVDLDFVQTIIEHGGGAYYWTVVVVQEEPYERVGAWGEMRPFTYVVPDAPAEPTAESP